MAKIHAKGEFLLKMTEPHVAESANKGTKSIEAIFVDPQTNDYIRGNLYLTDTAMKSGFFAGWRQMEVQLHKLAQAGADYVMIDIMGDGKPVKIAKPTSEALAGAEGSMWRVTTEIEEYEGKQQCKVAFADPLTGNQVDDSAAASWFEEAFGVPLDGANATTNSAPQDETLESTDDVDI